MFLRQITQEVAVDTFVCATGAMFAGQSQMVREVPGR